MKDEALAIGCKATRIVVALMCMSPPVVPIGQARVHIADRILGCALMIGDEVDTVADPARAGNVATQIDKNLLKTACLC